MRKQQRYTPEFKAEAVKLVLELGTRDSAIIAAMLPVMKRNRLSRNTEKSLQLSDATFSSGRYLASSLKQITTK